MSSDEGCQVPNTKHQVPSVELSAKLQVQSSNSTGPGAECQVSKVSCAEESQRMSKGVEC